VWNLVATALEKAVEKDAFDKLPTEIMLGVALPKVYNIDETPMYVFQASEESLHYFVVKTGHMWKAAGGKYCRQHV